MISRPYLGAADLRLMQEALIGGYDSTETRIGDLAWRARYHTHYELALEIRLWFDGSDLTAWTWLRTLGGFDTYVVPERRDDERLWTELLDSIEEIVNHRLRAGTSWRRSTPGSRMTTCGWPQGWRRAVSSIPTGPAGTC